MSKDKILAAKVEEQSGRCRQLAIDLFHHAEKTPFLTDPERNILKHYADSMADIANGLTQAMRDEDHGRLRRFWKWSGVAAGALVVAGVTGVATGSATGASQAATERLLDSPTIEQQASKNR